MGGVLVARSPSSEASCSWKPHDVEKHRGHWIEVERRETERNEAREERREEREREGERERERERERRREEKVEGKEEEEAVTSERARIESVVKKGWSCGYWAQRMDGARKRRARCVCDARLNVQLTSVVSFGSWLASFAAVHWWLAGAGSWVLSSFCPSRAQNSHRRHTVWIVVDRFLFCRCRLFNGPK